MPKLVEFECQKWIHKGVNVKYVIRANHNGYKAGTLKEGLEKEYVEDCEFVAIFDANFHPDPNFLWKIIPYLLENPKLGLVQVSNEVKFNLLQSANDTIIVGEGTWHNLWDIKAVFRGFELVSRLHVNFIKSKVIGLNIKQSVLEVTSSFLACGVRIFPFFVSRHTSRSKSGEAFYPSTVVG
ncbi:hypothetical protein KIW84_054100 [Lathyrus oleraceus]|uniref:Glycosyltransferase 2-like domain-containing protein n=1 Tax=Pisum sativum TaxID=3888 RepID=A0A9D5AE40_PEA|nr:hypothetical protein KIW84_054100 [Pisum sativum]